MISQSGNVAVNALSSRRGINFHTVISSGNAAVCDPADWLLALCEREGVGSVAMFLESDGDGAKLAEALACCADRGIGVAVLKVGASAAGAAAAAAHTGRAGRRPADLPALVEEAGGSWAQNPHELLELARVLAEPRARPSGDGGLAILTCSGGDSGIAADEAERLGVALPPLSEPTAASLRGLLPEAVTVGNPLDYTSLIWGDKPLTPGNRRDDRGRPLASTRSWSFTTPRSTCPPTRWSPGPITSMGSQRASSAPTPRRSWPRRCRS